jgi:hypothetical protein
MKITTYLDSAAAPELECAPRPRLVYRCWIHKMPGFSEILQFHYGPSLDGRSIALWLSSDWSLPESSERFAVAWTTDKKLSSKPWADFLRAYWMAEKDQNLWDEPNFSEIKSTPRSLMKPDEIWALALSVWPESDVDLASE